MSIVADATPKRSTVQFFALSAGLPMFAIGAIGEVAILAVSGMLITLIGALMWARSKRDAPPPTARPCRWWRYPVDIPGTLALTVGLSVGLLFFVWLDRQ